MNSQNKIITDLAIYLQENLKWIYAFVMLVRIFIDNWKSRGKEMHDWNLLPNLSDFYFFYSIICLDSTDIISMETEKKKQEFKCVWPWNLLPNLLCFVNFLFFVH